MCRCAAKICTTVASGGKDGILGPEAVESAIFLVVSNDAFANTIFHDQVGGEELNKVLRIVP
jgi:hypothetical protein